MNSLMISVFLLAVSQDGNQAEKAFRASEKKLSESDTIQISFTCNTNPDRRDIGIGFNKGTILIAKGNKVRFDLIGDVPGQPGQTVKVVSISDGTKMTTQVTKGDDQGKVMVQDSPKTDSAMLAGVVSRAGVFTIGRAASGTDQNQRKLDDFITVADFSMGKKEKVGNRQAQRIDYKLTINIGIKETIDAQVWLDSETHMPLKRVLSVKHGEEAVQVTETYDIHINGKIDASKFELPK
jgi:outer membrane lipoprotein-sorting protein